MTATTPAIQIDRLAERQKIAAFLARVAAIEVEKATAIQQLEIERDTLRRPVDDALNAQMAKQNAAKSNLRARHAEEWRVLSDALAAEASSISFDPATQSRLDGIEQEWETIEAPFDERIAALYDAEGGTLADWPGSEDGDDPQLCALTGLPILEDDETLVDEISGEAVLRVAVFGPRPAAHDVGHDADGVITEAA